MAPEGAPPKAPVGKFAWHRRPISAHPSHVSWPHRELRLRPQWESSHGTAALFRYTPHADLGPIEVHRVSQWESSRGTTALFRHTPHTFRGPIGSSADGLTGEVRMAPTILCCWAFVVKRQRRASSLLSPPPSSLLPPLPPLSACPSHVGTPPIGFVAPLGAPPKAPVGKLAWFHRPISPRPHTFRGPTGSST